jgi:uncharacterized protein (DUF305 family)
VRNQKLFSGGLFIAALCVALVSACGSQPKPNSADQTFVAQMVPHHQLGIEMIDSAVLRSDDVRLRKLVFQMQSYHEHELHQLSSLLQQWEISPAETFPGSIDPSRLAAIDQLSGPAYDIAWLNAMIEHHEGAVAIGKMQMKLGQIPDLIDVAKKVVTTQQAEIIEMQRILDKK